MENRFLEKPLKESTGFNGIEGCIVLFTRSRFLPLNLSQLNAVGSRILLV
jgi:hypothetical protein